jgi:hypothetical protein
VYNYVTPTSAANFAHRTCDQYQNRPTYLIKIPKRSQSAVGNRWMACRETMAVLIESHDHFKYPVRDKLNLLLLHYMVRIVTIRPQNANVYCKTALPTLWSSWELTTLGLSTYHVPRAIRWFIPSRMKTMLTTAHKYYCELNAPSTFRPTPLLKIDLPGISFWNQMHFPARKLYCSFVEAPCSSKRIVFQTFEK